MRVEVLYAPGCSSYTKARNTLEILIAEEGLPLPVEVIEENSQTYGLPKVRIDGKEAVSDHIEHLRETICRHWKELTEKQLTSAF